MAPDVGTLLTAVGALAAVLALIVLAAWLARRGGFVPRSTTGQELLVQETIALDSRRRLHLIRWGDRHALLLTGGPQDLVVGWLNQPPSSLAGGPAPQPDRAP
jgi:flagellar protein FliO/FliZ